MKFSTRGCILLEVLLFALLCVTTQSERGYDQDFPWLQADKAAASPGPSDPIDPSSGQCQMVSQVQSVVIQILSTHYEYAKGIHTLHSLVDSIQKDMVVMKSSLKDYEKSYKRSSQREQNEIKFNDQGTYLGDKHAQHLMQTLWDNVTLALGAQNEKLLKLEKRQKSVRRTLTRSLDKHVEEIMRSRLHSVDMMSQFMEKQKETNRELLQKLQWAEKRQAGERPQSDAAAPSTTKTGDCPEGFVRYFLSCYKFGNDTLTWVDAEKYCQTVHHDAHLVAVETLHEQTFILNYRNYNTAFWTSAYLWLGGTTLRAAGAWTWVGTGQPLTFTQWRAGEPSHQRGGRDTAPQCIYLRTQGSDAAGGGDWDDWPCHAARLNYVCEIRLSAQ